MSIGQVGEELIRALRKSARKRAIPFELLKDRGRGGLYLVAVGFNGITLHRWSALKLSIRFRLRKGEYLPACTPVLDGEHAITMSAKATAKAAVCQAWQEAEITKTEWAWRMGRDVVEVRRTGDGTRNETHQLEEGAKALGGRLSIGFLGADQ